MSEDERSATKLARSDLGIQESTNTFVTILYYCIYGSMPIK